MLIRMKQDQDGFVVYLPNELLAEAGITPNDLVQITAADGKLILTKSFAHQNMVERAAAYNGELKFSEEAE